MKKHITRFLMAFGSPCLISIANAQVDANMLPLTKGMQLIMEALEQNPPENMNHPAFQKR